MDEQSKTGAFPPLPEPESSGRRILADLVNEFAAVRLTLDLDGNGPRLLVEDLESQAHIFLCPLELASFTLASNEDRENWLRVGHYRRERTDGTTS